MQTVVKQRGQLKVASVRCSADNFPCLVRAQCLSIHLWSAPSASSSYRSSTTALRSAIEKYNSDREIRVRSALFLRKYSVHLLTFVGITGGALDLL